MESENGIPHKKEWIRLYSLLNSSFIKETGRYINRHNDYETNEVEYLLTTYLQEIKPVIKDLKESPDAIFVRDYSNGYPVEPASAQSFLNDRAVVFAQKFRNILPNY